MKYEIKKLPKSEVEITVEVTEDEMAQYKNKACDEISKEVEVKGFRKGHVPPHILEEYVNKNMILAHAIEMGIQQSYAEAVIKEKIQVVSRPKVKVEKESPLKYIATVAVLPEVDIKDYKEIKIKKDEPKVKKEEVESILKDMQKYGTTFKEVDRAAQKGDRVEVDFEGFDKDKAVENTKSTNHPVIIGEGSLIPGFEDELIGLKKDEKKEFDITFPKDYGKKDFQGRKLKFKVEVKRVEEPQQPELNEEFIEKMTGKKQTLDDLKKEIETNILARKKEEAKQKRENEYLEELLKKTKVELPESLIDEEAEHILHDVKEEISRKKVEFTKFLERAKTTEEELRKKYRVEAERRIKVRLALQFILKAEKIEITEKDTEDEYKKIKGMYPENQHNKIEADYKSGELKTEIRNRLSIEKLFDRVLG